MSPTERQRQARREALAIITAIEDGRLARQMFEGRSVSDWELARELAGAAAGAILVVAECQGIPEHEALANAGLGWAEEGTPG